MTAEGQMGESCDDATVAPASAGSSSPRRRSLPRTYAELRARTDEQVQAEWNLLAGQAGGLPIEWWSDEIFRREQAKATNAMRNMTIVILICTVANAVIAGALLWLAMG
jgi:hypothetical protein